MRVTVRLFAQLRERAGRDSIEIELSDGATARDALEAAAREAGLEELVERMSVAIAVNHQYVRGAVPLGDGDELALIPPVSGGAPSGAARLHLRVTTEPLSIEGLLRAVGHRAAGATVVFAGTTRDVARLEYEAYAEMAEERIERILGEVAERHGLAAAAAEHRVGGVPLGEASVVVAVSAAHRDEAFAGAREAIDRIKAEAPIWKREISGDPGAERSDWVSGGPPTTG